METRARYILVGIFTLLSLAAALGFILWLAKVQIDRTYAQYDIVFDTVAGLGQASAVQYNGVDVGKVQNIALDRFDPSLVRVRIEIYASTPIRQDTVATLASQGVTGVSFVALAGGRAESERLAVIPPAEVPVIASKPSVVQGLIIDAPNLLAEAILLMRDIRAFTTSENGAAITAILENVERATARIDSMANRTEAVMASAEATLDLADSALTEAQTAFASANMVIGAELPALVDRLKAALDEIGRSATGIETFTRTGLPQFRALVQETRSVVANIGATASRIGSDPGRFLLGNQTPAYRN
ncbi:MAG: MlaD family protein [Paracoccaceae bacterium]|jgi:phospholipid/cholesterol/gamma-HCH transport system substrate-binding protein|uniref:MlaD family protein n=1 Tax=unclassified Seohaeicola TaxID=2641111 RepID=UPI00237B6D77|nr:MULTISPECIES: MlaD family protein [unclassified Seohaeicola]MDD9707180.1 MlaD family protein [Seohaeicola sp. 4SK31]MDD9735421.1 MlaD family protein [Seohaeicola sp. SP36]